MNERNIIKKDGSIAAFDKSKITNAIKTAIETNGEAFGEAVSNLIQNNDIQLNNDLIIQTML